jgi:hypothetical protein
VEKLKYVRRLLSHRESWHEDDSTLWVESDAVQPFRRIELQFRADGDVELAFSLTGIAGSPFEQQFVVY